MKIIQLENCRLYFGKVPEGAKGLHVFNDGEPYLFYRTGVKTFRYYLPPGNWQILARADSVTEEQARGIVDWYEEDTEDEIGYSGEIIYPDYTKPNESLTLTCKYTALESFHSLLAVNNLTGNELCLKDYEQV